MTLHPYEALTPDVVLDALASVGLHGDGRLLALSSYENRVYQVHLEDAYEGNAAGGGEVLPARPLERSADPGGTRLRRELPPRKCPRSRRWC